MLIGNGELLHGDCLELMKDIPDNSVDMIVTDPPYGMGFISNYRKVKHNKIINDHNLLWLPDTIKEMYRITANNSVIYCFCSYHKIDIFKQNIEEYFKIKNILVWEKNNTSMGDLTGDFAPKCEFIILAQKGRCQIRGSRDPNIFKFPRTNNEFHPTQKPVALFEYLITKFSDIGDVVFDPFSGSGTTAIAAENTNRRWICIEQDDTYYQKSIERIKKTVDINKNKVSLEGFFG